MIAILAVIGLLVVVGLAIFYYLWNYHDPVSTPSAEFTENLPFQYKLPSDVQDASGERSLVGAVSLCIAHGRFTQLFRPSKSTPSWVLDSAVSASRRRSSGTEFHSKFSRPISRSAATGTMACTKQFTCESSL